jgi:transcription elongation GreA/GreB family factor
MKTFDKEKILEACKAVLLQRIDTAGKAMKAAQESSNSEDKSSAGDKYETARAMGQIDRNMNAKQLAQAQQELAELKRIDLQPAEKVKAGSLVICASAVYFIAIGLGTITVEGTPVVVISPKSPLALQMIGKAKGASFSFNQRNITIENLL